MHADLLAQTHLLVLPLVALFLFLTVYFVVIVRAMTSSRKEISSLAHIPFEEDSHE
jgi:hypothetical protein